MDFSNKSNITTISSGKNKTITWGSKSTINFGSEYTINSGSTFRNTVGTIIDFAGGNELLWSAGTVMKYDLKDVYRYHLRGSTSVGRNTAMKHQNYFYATAGFDADMADATKKYFSNIDNSIYRHKIVNYVLKAMNFAYKFMGQIDSGSKVTKIPVGTWTESTREALQKGTSGVVYSLDKVKTIVTFLEGWHFKGGFWKNFVRKDFQPNALVQISSTKGVFLGAQYENLAEAGTRTTAALYLDNMIRLRASSTEAESASNVFYPRDVQTQGSMKPQDWISPEKIVTEVSSRVGREPTEYAEFNGFKVPADSSVDIGPAGIDIYSNTITSHALNHVQKSVTREALEYKAAKALVAEIKVKLEIAKKQESAIQTGAAGAVMQLTAAEMALAPLAAAAATADKTQKAYLLAEAKKLVAILSMGLAAAKRGLSQKANAADAAKGFSELKTSAEFFELSTESSENKVSIKGSSDLLLLKKNKSQMFMTDDLVGMAVEGSKCGFGANNDSVSLVADDAIINVKKDSIVLTGGGSEIKLANSSVTIGDLKITQVGGNTKVNMLKDSKRKIESLDQKLEKLQKSFDESITKKDQEIDALRSQLAELGRAANNRIPK